MTILAALLVLLAGFLTLGVGVNVGSLYSSDAAGNGIAQGFAVALAIAVWVVLFVLLLMCAARDGFPGLSGLAVIFVYPLAIAGQMLALRLLTESKVAGAAAILLPFVVMAGPIVIIVRAAWGIFPAVRASVPESAGSWGPIVLLVVIFSIPLPYLPAFLTRRAAAQELMESARKQYQEKQKVEDDQHVQETLARIEALPTDGHLFSAMVYCSEPEEVVRKAARAKARTFPKRQADAEELLAQNHEPTLRELPNFDLQATPAVCERAKNILASKRDIKPFDNDPIRIEDAEREVAPYVETMRWLLARGCDGKGEIADIERAVNRYTDSPRRQKLLADLAAAKSSR